MPNHCENDLYFHGSDADIATVLAHIGADKNPPQFDFDAIIPYPDRYRQMDEDHNAIPDLVGVYRDSPEWSVRFEARKQAMDAYVAKWGTRHDGFNSGGIEWRREHWGTKWGAYDVKRRDYDGTICLTFQTAWVPPRPIIIALAKRFPTVGFTLESFERGMSFAGGFTCPSEQDWYNDEPWHAGIVTDEWETNEYHGHRGG